MTWLLLLPMLLASAYSYWCFRRMANALLNDVYRLGPRMRWRVTRPAMRGAGIWMLVMAGTMTALAIMQGTAPVTNSFALWMMGVVMIGFPNFFTGELPKRWLSKHDHKEPIGPPVDPYPWIRTEEGIESWLIE